MRTTQLAEGRAGENSPNWAPAPRLPLTRHLPLILSLAALAIALYTAATRREPSSPALPPALPYPAVFGAVPRAIILILAGVGARVVLRGVVKALIALAVLLLLVQHWPTVLGALDALFAHVRVL